MRTEYLIAIFVAVMWSFAPIFMIHLVRQYGALLCNAVRIVFSAMIFISIAVFYSDFSALSEPAIIAACISGLVGVLIGDGVLYVGLKRLGPRRNTLIFSSNTLFSIILGVAFLGEQYSSIIWLGVALVIVGIFMAILYAPSRSGRTKVGKLVGDDDVLGNLSIGIAASVCAAFCQAYGLFVLAPFLQDGGDPTVFTALRLSAAAVFCAPFLAYKFARSEMLPLRAMAIVSIIGLCAMGIGSFLLQYALQTAELGIINMLSATSPIWVLPLLWWKTRAMPHAIAWLGALIGLWGLSCIFLPDFYLSLFDYGIAG